MSISTKHRLLTAGSATALILAITTGPGLAQSEDAGPSSAGTVMVDGIEMSLDDLTLEDPAPAPGGTGNGPAAGDGVADAVPASAPPGGEDLAAPDAAPTSAVPGGEDLAAPETRAADAEVEDVAPSRPRVPGNDPITEDRIEDLDNAGVLDRQARYNEGIMLMQRQAEHANAVRNLISILGPEAEIEIAPGEFRSFEDTPAALQARIEIERMRQTLTEMEAPEEVQDPQTIPEPLPPRSDGSEYFLGGDGAASGGGGAVTMSRSEIDALVAERSRQIAEETIAQRISSLEQRFAVEPDRRETSLSLREIYGSGGSYTAIIEVDGVRVRVRPGDELPGDLRILEVARGAITVDQDGDLSEIDLPR